MLYTALELSDKVRVGRRGWVGGVAGWGRAHSPVSISLALPCTSCPHQHPCHAATPLRSRQICCSFGVDVLEALAASCTQLAAEWSPRAAADVACDALVASLLLALHGATLMSQV